MSRTKRANALPLLTFARPPLSPRQHTSRPGRPSGACEIDDASAFSLRSISLESTQQFALPFSRSKESSRIVPLLGRLVPVPQLNIGSGGSGRLSRVPHGSFDIFLRPRPYGSHAVHDTQELQSGGIVAPPLVNSLLAVVNLLVKVRQCPSPVVIFEEPRG